MDNAKLPKIKQGADRVEVLRKKAEEFLKKHTTIESCLAAARDQRNGSRTRIFALIGVMLNAVPGARKRALNMLKRTYDFSLIPINPEMYALKEEQIGSGYWCEAFLLEPRQEGLERRVLKIEFPAKHYSGAELAEKASRYRDEHEFLRDAYKEIQGFVVQTDYLVATSPRTGMPAVAHLQAYAGDDPFDLFSPEKKDVVRELLVREPDFKWAFDTFRRVTLQLQRDGKAPDLAGQNNVLVVKVGELHELRLVDHHGLDPDNAIAQAAQERTIEYLKRL